MFKSAGLAKMFAGRRKFFRGPHVRHLWCRQCKFLKYESVAKLPCGEVVASNFATW